MEGYSLSLLFPSQDDEGSEGRPFPSKHVYFCSLSRPIHPWFIRPPCPSILPKRQNEKNKKIEGMDSFSQRRPRPFWDNQGVDATMALPLLYVQKTLAELVLELEEVLDHETEIRKKVQLALAQARNEVSCHDTTNT